MAALRLPALLASLILGIVTPALAQSGEGAPFPGAEAKAEMAALTPLAGRWTARVDIMQRDGRWHRAGEEEVAIHFLLDGMALREAPAEHPVNDWRLETTIQYDQNRDVFRLVAMDDTWGNMDVYEGGWASDGRLVMDNLGSGTSYVGPDGSTLHFRLTTDIIDADAHVFLVEMTADAGETWRPYQRIERVRLAVTDE